MALKIKRAAADAPKHPVVEVPTEEKLSCGHSKTKEASDGSCWACHAAKLADKFYRKQYTEPIKQTPTEESKMKIKKATPEAKSKETKKAVARTNDDRRRISRTEGKTLKLGVNQTWIRLFEENEALAKKDKALTDAEITAFLNKEFPDRKSEVFKAVATVRSRYNRGVLTGDKEPKAKSHPYNKEAKEEPKKKSK